MENDETKTWNMSEINLNDPEKQAALEIIKGKFYHKDNQRLYSDLEKAYNNLGFPWVAHHQYHKDRRSGWTPIKDFYYSNDTAYARK